MALIEFAFIILTHNFENKTGGERYFQIQIRENSEFEKEGRELT